MLDINFIKKNSELIKENARNRNVKVDIDQLLDIYEEKNRQSEQLNQYLHQKKIIAQDTKKAKKADKEKLIAKGKGSSKQNAEQEAARKALDKMGWN